MLTCGVFSYCRNHGKDCDYCISNPSARFPNVIECFSSSKCGFQSLYCVHRYDIDVCIDCDPFDSPCCLFQGIDVCGGE